MNMKHNNKGFSLVELIVVIAIMAILGSVGTAGYTKYIEQTNKKADMALVGNIMRAVETSAADISNEGFNNLNKFSTLDSLPVGFIILSQEGDVQTISVDAEGTTINKNDSSLVKTEKFYYYSKTSGGKDIYDSVEITYLLEGASINRANVYYTEWFQTKTAQNAALLSGSTFTRVDESTKTYNTDNSTLLSNALASAFGDTYATDIRLKYDKWANEVNSISIRSNVQETWARVMGLMKTSTNILASAQGGLGDILGDIAGAVLTEDQLMKQAVNGLVNNGQVTADGKLTISEEEFMARWLAPGSKGGAAKNETFGITDQTTYTGLRSAWNSYLGEYIISNGSCSNKATHAARLYSYTDKNGGSSANVRVVTHDILTGTDSSSTFKCESCAVTMQEYLTDTSENGALYKSGKSMYDAFTMAAAASQDPNFDSASQTYASYFADYMGQMDAMYSAVNRKINDLETGDESYIVIAVSSNYGVVECEVLPPAANPRNK